MLYVRGQYCRVYGSDYIQGHFCIVVFVSAVFIGLLLYCSLCHYGIYWVIVLFYSVSVMYVKGPKLNAICHCAVYGVIIVWKSISVRYVLDDYCNAVYVSAVSKYYYCTPDYFMRY